MALTALIGLATVRFQRSTGIQIEARHREALHSAIMTAARVAAALGLTREVATEFVSSYVRASVPDALKRLSPSAETLDALVRATLLVAKHWASRPLGALQPTAPPSTQCRHCRRSLHPPARPC
ncbi:hypothetical protein D516_1690 [Rhodobacter sp. AKP1]|nr:Hypothetical Protein RSKD131_3827 [Cereibacter sphaeroides KD131]EKX57439.1 hypothetical protein D516_1690 [Rhodobacter sp. AKP1]